MENSQGPGFDLHPIQLGPQRAQSHRRGLRRGRQGPGLQVADGELLPVIPILLRPQVGQLPNGLRVDPGAREDLSEGDAIRELYVGCGQVSL